ncbi:MAG: PrgI family protein [Candidatus Paceibacterota bacterium]|jgi:hypothetical protein
MQFQVPQFIEIEDKIFGPLTLKEFIYLAGGVGLSVVIYLYISYKIISIPLILIVMAFSLALAFYKTNGKPFIDTVESAFYYFLGNRLYIWKKVDKTPAERPGDIIKEAKKILIVPKLSESKLKDLTWSLDINESLNPTTHNKK